MWLTVFVVTSHIAFKVKNSFAMTIRALVANPCEAQGIYIYSYLLQR